MVRQINVSVDDEFFDKLKKLREEKDLTLREFLHEAYKEMKEGGENR